MLIPHLAWQWCMPRPCRPVSPVPEGPAEEDQLQPWKRLGLEEEARKTGIIFRAGKSGREARWRRWGSFLGRPGGMNGGDLGVGECGGETEFCGRKRRFEIRVRSSVGFLYFGDIFGELCPSSKYFNVINPANPCLFLLSSHSPCFSFFTSLITISFSQY